MKVHLEQEQIYLVTDKTTGESRYLAYLETVMQAGYTTTFYDDVYRLEHKPLYHVFYTEGGEPVIVQHTKDEYFPERSYNIPADYVGSPLEMAPSWGKIYYFPKTRENGMYMGLQASARPGMYYYVYFIPEGYKRYKFLLEGNCLIDLSNNRTYHVTGEVY